VSIARSKGELLGQRIDEHERVVHVGADDRFLGARLGQPEPSFCGIRQLSREERFRKEYTEHMHNITVEAVWCGKTVGLFVRVSFPAIRTAP